MKNLMIDNYGLSIYGFELSKSPPLIDNNERKWFVLYVFNSLCLKPYRATVLLSYCCQRHYDYTSMRVCRRMVQLIDYILLICEFSLPHKEGLFFTYYWRTKTVLLRRHAPLYCGPLSVCFCSVLRSVFLCKG